MVISWRSPFFISPMTFKCDLPCSALMCALISMHIAPWSKWIFLTIRFIDDTLRNTMCKEHHVKCWNILILIKKTTFQSYLRWEFWRLCIFVLLQAVFEFPKQKWLDFPFCTGWSRWWHRGWEAEVGSLQWSWAPGVQCGGSGSGSYWRTRWTPEIRSCFQRS